MAIKRITKPIPDKTQTLLDKTKTLLQAEDPNTSTNIQKRIANIEKILFALFNQNP